MSSLRLTCVSTGCIYMTYGAAPATPREPGVSIEHASCFGSSINFRMRWDNYRGTVLSLPGKRIGTSSKRSISENPSL